MKKQDESWKVCSFCRYIKACDVGRKRIKDMLGWNSHAINDIGCFNYEIYKSQCDGSQLGLF